MDSREYLDNLFGDGNKELLKLEKTARERDIPIIEHDGLQALISIVSTRNNANVLEIGTAVGYSSIALCLNLDDITITTIERDEARYDEALINIERFGMKHRINPIFGDALETNIEGSYDIIFIDAAKGQYIKFFEKYKKLLAPNGLIISDNILFHGLIFDEIKNRNLRQLVRKIKEYHVWLSENEEFETNIIPIGDGISVSRRK